MDNMFCFQCEQTARGIGCTVSGVCGKKPDVANAFDQLTCDMIALAKGAIASKKESEEVVDVIVDGLFMSVTNVNFDTTRIAELNARVEKLRDELGGYAPVKPEDLFRGDEDITSLRSTLLFGLRGMAAYAHHARVLGKRDAAVDNWFITGMAAMFDERDVSTWVDLIMDFGKTNLRCMEILDEANTQTYGDPEPTKVSLTIEKGPFIVITGHDLKDLDMLLEQTKDRGVNIYTHGEMLPANAYPRFKKYPNLKGNFGTAWQNQQKEFANIPAPILFTTNCLMPPKQSYSDRVFTTSVVGFPEMVHIEADENGHKDFTEMIDLAIKLGGYDEDKKMTGINGGEFVMTGFARKTLLDNAGAIVSAVKEGAIKHFFLVGGCDGAKPGRNYYTEFVQNTPQDTAILTLACGKYRFNDLDLGNIGPFPRILDMGQCNDAYGAIRVASALAEAFDCSVNDLPLTLVLSWYEQKAVCVLLTLLSLGIKKIYIGPSNPAFFSPTVLNLLVEKFELTPISTPDEDMKKILS